MTEVVAVGWERIQLVVRLRATTRDRVGPVAEGIGLARLDGRSGSRVGATRVGPSHTETDADGTTVWFNVMCGTDQMPLPAGRWGVVAGPAGSPGSTAALAPLTVAADVTLDLLTASRAFSYGSQRYDVIAAVDPASRVVSFRIARVDLTRQRRGIVARARALLRPTWRALHGLPTTACIAIARRTVRRDRRRILFTGGSAREPRGNLRMVHDRMVARGLDREYDLRYSHGARRAADGTAGRLRLRDVWRVTRLVGSADAVVVTGSLHEWAGVVSPPPGTRYIQLWHAVGAFKTVGYSRIGKPRGPNPYSRLHKDYTHVVVSSEPMRRYYAEAFGVPVERVVATGVPRTDPFFDQELREASRQAALRAFPMVEGKMTILFAPTFRGAAGQATYDDSRIDFAAFHALAEERDAVVIFKMHPFVRKPVPIPDAMRDRLIDATRTPLEVNDLLFVVDLLISDYSTVIYEYATLGRPMLFFAYDLDAYIADRDFYEPYETFVPGRIVRTCDELLDAIRHDDYEIEKVAPFASRNFADVDGHATDRVIDRLILAP